MALALQLSRQAVRFIKTLPPKHYKQVVSTMLSLLGNSEPHDSQQLKGSKDNNRRVDIGEYRIIYRVDDANVWVLVIGKRNNDEVYKIFNRQ